MLGEERPNGFLSKFLGNRSDNGVSFNTVNKSVLLTVIWTLFSLSIIYFGYKHCAWNSYSYTLTCDTNQCIHSIETFDISYEKEYSRSSIKRAEIVRLNALGEEVIDPKERNNRKDGHSVKVVYSSKEEKQKVGQHQLGVENTFIISEQKMSRKYSKTTNTNLQKYIIKETDELYSNVSSSVTVTGVLICFFGSLSLLFSCIFGAWAEPRRKRGLKKSS
jgi:hypothetical protein